MGAAALVVESTEAARERGVRPICEVLGAVSANSAFHGTRLDVSHIGRVMEKLVSSAERRWGVNRGRSRRNRVRIARNVHAGPRRKRIRRSLRSAPRFQRSRRQIVVANTKGFTGHPMAVGIEDVVAVKMLETGIVPPVPNFKEVDPELGPLNLSKGGAYPVEYALRLGAGFGSQICMTLLRWVPTGGAARAPNRGAGLCYRIMDENAWNNWLGAYGRPFRRGAGSFPAGTAHQRSGAGGVSGAAPRASGACAGTGSRGGRRVHTGEGAGDHRREDRLSHGMLDLDLDLEADLGIDTVKQAEMFAAIRDL